MNILKFLSRYVLLGTLFLGVSIGTIVLLLTERVMTAFGSIPLAELAPALAGTLVLIPTVQFMRAWRFACLVRSKERTIRPFFAIFRISCLLVFANYLFPLKLGEALFPILMRRDVGTPLVTAIGILFLVRLTDLLLVSAAGGGGLIALRGIDSAEGMAGLALATGCVGAVITLPILDFLLGRMIPWLEGRLKIAHRLANRFHDGVAVVGSPKQYLLFVGQGLVIWSGIFAMGILWLHVVAPAAALWDAVIAAAANSISFALPINGIGGIGPAQAAWAYALTAISGLDWELAVVSAFLWHGAMFAATAILAGATFFFKQEQPR